MRIRTETCKIDVLDDALRIVDGTIHAISFDDEFSTEFSCLTSQVSPTNTIGQNFSHAVKVNAVAERFVFGAQVRIQVGVDRATALHAIESTEQIKPTGHNCCNNVIWTIVKYGVLLMFHEIRGTILIRETCVLSNTFLSMHTS